MKSVELVENIGAPDEQFFRLEESVYRQVVRRAGLKLPDKVVVDWVTDMTDYYSTLGLCVGKNNFIYSLTLVRLFQNEINNSLTKVASQTGHNSNLPRVEYHVLPQLTEEDTRQLEIHSTISPVYGIFSQRRLNEYFQSASNGFNELSLVRHQGDFKTSEDVRNHVEDRITNLVAISLRRVVGYLLGHELLHRQEYHLNLSYGLRMLFKLSPAVWKNIFVQAFIAFKEDKIGPFLTTLNGICEEIELKYRINAEERADKVGEQLYLQLQEAIVIDRDKLKKLIFRSEEQNTELDSQDSALWETGQ